MAAQTENRVITAEQYTALVQPVPPPTPEELFEYQREALVEARLAKLDTFDGIAKRLPNGLFLLVPAQPDAINKLDWADLMSRVELRGKKGRTYVSGSDMSDEIAAPTKPTVLKNVEDGRGRRNTRLPDSRANIKKDGRQPYTVWRGYIHTLLFPSVLDHHGLDIVASRYRSSFWLLFCLHDGKPTLNSRHGYAYPFWGAPSCGEVEEL